MMGVHHILGWYFIKLLFCLTVFLMNVAEEHATFTTFVANYENGKTKLAELRDRSMNPTYGQCWSNALNHLHRGCKQLSEKEQSRMALEFASCFLKMAGIDICDCNENEELNICLKKIKGDFIAFNAYTEFFTHTLHMCFFLESQVWHEHTENIISRLTKSSEVAAELLENSNKLQEEMLHKQDISLEQQAEVFKNYANLHQALQPLVVVLDWLYIIIFFHAVLSMIIVLGICKYCFKC